MSENDATLIIETTHGHEPIRVIHDDTKDKPDEHWWPVTISEDCDGNCWESFA